MDNIIKNTIATITDITIFIENHHYHKLSSSLIAIYYIYIITLYLTLRK